MKHAKGFTLVELVVVIVISTVVKRADGRVPVLAGTGSNSTSEAVRPARALQAAFSRCVELPKARA